MVAEHNGRHAAAHVIGVTERPAAQGRDAQHPEKSRRRACAREHLAAVRVAHCDVGLVVPLERGEHVLLSPPILEVWIRGLGARGHVAAMRLPEVHQPVRLLIRKGPEQHRVHDAEERGVRGDSDGEREDDDDGETGLPPVAAPGHARVLDCVAPPFGAGVACHGLRSGQKSRKHSPPGFPATPPLPTGCSRLAFILAIVARLRPWNAMPSIPNERPRSISRRFKTWSWLLPCHLLRSSSR